MANPIASPYAKPGPYVTQLDPQQEERYQNWVRTNKIPWRDSPTSDYDMRGYWKAQQMGDPNAKRAANLHFPDTYKTPYHASFSNESEYATPDAPHWNGNRLIDKAGNVMLDEDNPGVQRTMATNPLIFNSKALQRLPIPSTAVAAMPASPPPPPVPTNAPVLPTAAAPIVTKEPDAVAANTRASLLGHQQELQRLNDTGSGISQIKNPLLRGLAKVGDVAESIILPRAAAFTPGTEMNHQRLIGQEYGRIGQDLGQQYQQAKTEQENALTNYTNQRPDIEEAKIEQRMQAIRDRVAQAAAAHGQTVAWDENGLPAFNDDYNSQAFHDRQALSAMHEATAERGRIQAEIAKNHYVPGTHEFEEAQRKLKLAEQKLQATLAGLGIQRERVGLQAQNTALNEDKFYNPQPTATQRTKGDLAQSAIERVQEMRQIVKKHPDWFGPGAGRMQNVQTAIGSQDPDMQTYMSAAQYLADHSAGVFGGRGQYITQALHGLTDPHYNPQALNAALDEAEKSAQGFVSAGRVHAKGEKSSYGGDGEHSSSDQKIKTFNPKTGRLE